MLTALFRSRPIEFPQSHSIVRLLRGISCDLPQAQHILEVPASLIPITLLPARRDL
jgi:hypothetical protein